MMLSPSPPEDATPASKVLGNDDLVGEIISHVDSPTTLVRAALVSRRWLRRASDRAFLRRFRERHPPRLLGFYVTGDCVLHPEFVPMPPGTDLSAAHRRAGSVFDAFPPCSSGVWNSRNGRVLFDFTEILSEPRRFAVLDTLRHPGGAWAELPPTPPPTLPEWCQAHAMLLPDDDGDDATCYRVDVHHVDRNVSAQVSVLRSGTWTVRCAARADLTTAPERIPMITLLAGGYVYMVTVAGYIIGVNLATANLFAIELPEGVTYEYYGNLVPCRGDDPGVLYLFHVKEDLLRVWLRRMGEHDGAGEWVLRDTVSLKETCGDLVAQDSEPVDGDMFFGTGVVGVRDNAEFVFLELGHSDVVAYLHVRSKKAEKAYQRDPENDEIIEVHPFEMVWPPVFPALGPDEGEEFRQGNNEN